MSDWRDRELDRLRAEVAELREELAAWKQWADGEAEEDEQTQLVARVRQTLKLRKTPVRILLLMTQHPGRVFNREALLKVCRRSADDYNTAKVIDAHVFLMRRCLRAHGLPDALRTIWGQGWSIDPLQADAVRSLWQADAGAMLRHG